MWQKGACLPSAITFAIEVEKMTMEGALVVTNYGNV